MTANQSVDPILCVRDLSVSFYTPDGVVQAVRDVSFEISRGRTTALLGESGCGKSVTARAILNLIPTPGQIEKGAVLLEQSDDHAPVDILTLDGNSPEMRRIRWNEVSVIFQDPMGSLTPAFTVGAQLMEALRLHQSLTKDAAKECASALLARVGIPAPERRMNDYPHQLSGGMNQRVMIAMATACDPNLLIADEPTTALDVTIQAQVLSLLQEMQQQLETSILLITHDIGVVAEIAHDVVVMYLGCVVERGSVEQVFDNTQHPYTRQLFASMPKPDTDRDHELPSIPGTVPDFLDIPTGCPFRERCAHAFHACSTMPPMQEVAPGHHSACWLHTDTTMP